MALTKGKLLGTIAGEVSVDVSDIDQNRWNTAKLVAFANEGIRRLAARSVFRRTDIHVPVAGQVLFQTFAESHLIQRVEYNGCELQARSMNWIRDHYGEGWRTVRGTPEVFCANKHGIVICPPPVSGGTALSYTGSPVISETQGGKIDAADYFAFSEAGTIVHFTEGDALGVSDLTAANNLWITYAYMPADSAAEDTIPKRLESALAAFMRHQCYSTSTDPAEVATADIAKRDWEREADILGEAMQDDFLSSTGGAMVADLSRIC